MPKFKNFTLKKYLDVLSDRTPVPGGGSAAALTAALGCALISMVARYSLGKGKGKTIEGKIQKLLKQSEKFCGQLLTLVDLDAEAYLKVVKARKGTPAQKKSAANAAAKVPLEVCRLCYNAIALTPLLVEHGNKYLLSDVQVAIEFLLAAFNAAMVNVEVNQ